MSTEVESYIKNTLVLENKYNGLMTFKKFIINFIENNCQLTCESINVKSLVSDSDEIDDDDETLSGIVLATNDDTQFKFKFFIDDYPVLELIAIENKFTGEKLKHSPYLFKQYYTGILYAESQRKGIEYLKLNFAELKDYIKNKKSTNQIRSYVKFRELLLNINNKIDKSKFNILFENKKEFMSLEYCGLGVIVNENECKFFVSERANEFNKKFFSSLTIQQLKIDLNQISAEYVEEYLNNLLLIIFNSQNNYKDTYDFLSESSKQLVFPEIVGILYERYYNKYLKMDLNSIYMHIRLCSNNEKNEINLVLKKENHFLETNIQIRISNYLVMNVENILTKKSIQYGEYNKFKKDLNLLLQNLDQ